jgi:ribonuclease HI
MDVLRAAWARAEWRALASRRACFGFLAAGVDRWATRRLLCGGALPVEVAGALRTVMSGDVVTENVAAKWSGRGTLCPHCKLACEDARHRFWGCPAWDAVRADAVRGGSSTRDVREVAASVPDGTALTGVLPVPLRLAALAEAAAASCLPSPPASSVCTTPVTVWTDGACLHPADPYLARAGWGLRLDSEEPLNMGGPVSGAQTAQRAEVTAALAACLVTTDLVDLVTDSDYVRKSVSKLAAGASADGWRHADLWALIAPHVRSGRIRARWVRAHCSAAAAREQGISERDRLGNAAADSNAGGAALQCLPPPGVIQERLETLASLELVQRCLGAVQLAVLRAHARDNAHAAPARRDWRRVRRGARRQQQRQPRQLQQQPAQLQAERGAATVPPAAAPGPGAPTAAPDRAENTQARSLRALFEGQAWHSHVAAQGLGMVVCLRCGTERHSANILLGQPCGGWCADFPPRGMGLLIVGGARHAGGSVSVFNELVSQRLAQLPRAPD